jgi:hypothetical protein
LVQPLRLSYGLQVVGSRHRIASIFAYPGLNIWVSGGGGGGAGAKERREDMKNEKKVEEREND